VVGVVLGVFVVPVPVSVCVELSEPEPVEESVPPPEPDEESWLVLFAAELEEVGSVVPGSLAVTWVLGASLLGLGLRPVLA
jgi:hypothetical protein